MLGWFSGGSGGGSRFGGQAVQVAFQNRFHALVGAGVEPLNSIARPHAASRRVGEYCLPSRSMPSQAGPVALFGYHRHRGHSQNPLSLAYVCGGSWLFRVRRGAQPYSALF